MPPVLLPNREWWIDHWSLGNGSGQSSVCHRIFATNENEAAKQQ